CKARRIRESELPRRFAYGLLHSSSSEDLSITTVAADAIKSEQARAAAIDAILKDAYRSR
ncbi:MAG: hypothetical protein M3160_10240, partial [Candidatus Eremiobacteraeota bacterium]|nr:hypothetical protein [Candidatus Eremiobacteraeota bacterium]